MRKKASFKWVGLIIVVLMLSTSGIGNAGSEKILKMAYIAPPPVWGPIADIYAKEVAKLQPGLNIKSFGGGQLGPITQNFAELKMGKLDMVLTEMAVLSLPKGGESFNIFFAPYVFNSQSHLHKFIDSDLFKTMVADTEKTAGFKYVGLVGDRTPRVVTTSNRKVLVPEDLKGLKLRVPLVKPIKLVMEGWGATPTPLSGSEMYMAMKQGVVDGQDNGFDAIFGAKYYEVQKYVSPINYVRAVLVVVVSEKIWKKLTPDEQKALLDACAPAEKLASKYNDEIIAKSIAGVQEKGMVILEPDVEAFKRTAEKIVKEKLDGKVWPAGLYDKVRALD